MNIETHKLVKYLNEDVTDVITRKISVEASDWWEHVILRKNLHNSQNDIEINIVIVKKHQLIKREKKIKSGLKLM